MITLDPKLTPSTLLPSLERFWLRSADCIAAVEKRFPVGSAAPVLTVGGVYTARGWTEWTQGFQIGSALLQFDATCDEQYLALGRDRTFHTMPSYLTHTGVHDHGFNIISTYGNLWRLMNERRIPENSWERRFYELALKISGAVQAARWSTTSDGTGYIYSFNGRHSLFVDTIRTCRVLALADQLGHCLMGEHDEKISLLRRLLDHVSNTARFNIWYGEERDAYDVLGRTAHESIFNTSSGEFRCSSTQQGYSPFSTWTRGLAWAILGFAEQLEWVASIPSENFAPFGGLDHIEAMMLRAAKATSEFYIRHTPTDGIPYWDTGAPGLDRLGDWSHRPADPFNSHEPVDSSAAVIAAQGLLRLGHYLVHTRGETESGVRYVEAGLAVAQTIFGEPYLSTDPSHEGLILHSVYHRPNAWDYIPPGQTVPCGESSMWGDYHARELAIYIARLASGAHYHSFFGADHRSHERRAPHRA